MSDLISKTDVRNGCGFAIGLFAVTLLVILGLSFLFYNIFTNNVVDAVPAPDSITLPAGNVNEEVAVVQVANATAISGRAAEASRRLDNLDFVTLDAFNVEERQNQSTIYFAINDISRQSEAKQIASVFQINEDLVQPFPDDFELEGLDANAQVLVILGKDAKL